MKNKIKNIFKILVVTAGCFLFASFSPSLDGRAVVVDNGVFPQGLFAKTVGYLPGDIISVTNIAGDRTIDLLVIGALDPSEGVAIMLSPEAADAMGIEKGANNIVKITKRSGQDERVYGSAIISKSAAELDDYEDNFETIGAEENTDAFDDNAVAEAPLEEEADEASSEIEADEDFDEESLDEEFEEEEAFDEELEEEAEEEAENFEDSEEESDFEEDELEEELEEEEFDEVEEELDEELDEGLDEGLDEESEFDEEPLDEEIEEEEDLAEEYSEENPEDLEEGTEEEAFEDEELSELPADEEIDEEVDEELEAEEAEETEAAVEPETESEEEFEDEALEESVEEEAFDENLSELEEEEDEEVPAAEEFDEEAAEEAFEADELDALPENFDEEAAEESDVETDEYEAIVLVPVDSNPPESESDEVEDVISEDELDAIEEVEEITESAPVPDTPAASVTETKKSATSYDKYMVPSLKDLESGKYYIQIAVYAADENILEIINRYGNNYPVTIVPMAGGNAKQILIGPVTMDEYKVVLERFKSYGFKDAFLRKIK